VIQIFRVKDFALHCSFVLYEIDDEFAVHMIFCRREGFL